jgi:hypothetical protein
MDAGKTVPSRRTSKPSERLRVSPKLPKAIDALGAAWGHFSRIRRFSEL